MDVVFLCYIDPTFASKKSVPSGFERSNLQNSLGSYGFVGDHEMMMTMMMWLVVMMMVMK